MNGETIFWLIVTLSAVSALGFMLGESDGEPPFNSADERMRLPTIALALTPA